MTLPAHFTFTVSDPNETDLVIVSLHDSRTNFTVRTALPNSGKQTASIMAFAGARYSRSDLSANDLFKEIHEAKKSANERLATIFKAYGHASVADMAVLFAYIENVPDLYAPIFYSETSVGAGQHRSTRYQDFSNSAVTELGEYLYGQNIDEIPEFASINEEFKDLQDNLLTKYRKWVAKLTQKYTEVYQVDTKDKKQAGALTARVFDTARYFLPAGTALKSSFAYITSAREWARIISIFKSNQDKYMQYLGEQMEYLFAPDQVVADEIGYVPEAPDLIRYTSSDETTSNNLIELEKALQQIQGFQDLVSKVPTTVQYQELNAQTLDLSVTPGTKVLAQSILSIYPNTNWKDLIAWIEQLNNETKIQISQILFHGFNHHNQMGNQFKLNTHTFPLTCSISETRDLIRHRAWGRFIPMLSIQKNYSQILYQGYTLPAYLTHNSELASARQEFEADLVSYYTKFEGFINRVQKLDWFPENLILQLLPFAHVMQLWFHASPKEIDYMAKLRVRPGGHINYRILAYEIAELAGKSEPLLYGIEMETSQKPDPSSREEFVDRS